MPLLKKFFKFYLDASVHVALAVISLYWVTVKNLNISVNSAIVGFLFCSTIVCYNFIKYGVEADKYFVVTKPYHRSIQIFSFIAFGFAMYFFVQLSSKLWLLLIVLMLLSGLYALPFWPSSKNLRSLGILKIVLVAVVWTGLTAALPLLDDEVPWSFGVLLLLFRRFLLILILILPFEIRDMHFDPPELRTLPQRYGVTGTKTIGYLLVLFYLALVFIGDSLQWPEVIIQVLVICCMFLALYRSKADQHRYFASFWVEGIPIFLAVLYYFLGA